MADKSIGVQDDNNHRSRYGQDFNPMDDNGDGTIYGGTPKTPFGEKIDPNVINVALRDTITPIVVLFGPPACGKTMTLVRLARYLMADGYHVQCDRMFRPIADAGYDKLCDDFCTMVASDIAADSTNVVNFLLVQVRDQRGNRICQILEAPGEHYFDPCDPWTPFPRYIYQLITSPNRKIWCFMVEPDWLDEPACISYVEKIKASKRIMRTSDKSIFIFNKIDKTPYELSLGKVDVSAAKKMVENQYPGIFVPFRRKRVLFGYSDDFEFVPFQTGLYQQYYEEPDKLGFTASPDEYPRNLWKAIVKQINS